MTQQHAQTQRASSRIFQPSDYEVSAQAQLPEASFAYIAGGSGKEQTCQANLRAFDNIELLQRSLCDVTAGSTATTVLNQHIDHPIMLAPVAAHRLVHPDGELATARAADALNAGMIVSTLSSVTLEDIAQQTAQTLWFQLYFQSRRSDTLALVQRAEAAGYQAIVVTLDTPIQSLSIRAQRAGFQLPAHAQAINLAQQLPPEQVTLAPTDSVIFQGMMQEAPTWRDITWLAEQTDLPIILKGVTHPDNIALLTKDAPIAGIIVSNHGGRALDGVPASLRMLPRIRDALGADYPILFDSGIRSGYDVFKALALGADAVCIGRMQMYALAVNGAQGVAHLLKMLRDELELCMALTGCARIKDIDHMAIASLSLDTLIR